MNRFFTPEFFVDPYPTYEELREEPVRWSDELEGWVLTGYADVAAALADPRVSRGRGPQEGDLLTRLLTRMMLFTITRPHAPARSRTGRSRHGESRAAAADRRARRRQLADVDEGEWDLVEALAYPLPVVVIAEILSLPPADRALFKRWSDDVIAVAAGVGEDPERRERALHSANALAEYFAALVAELKAHPNETLLSGLVGAEEEGIRLSAEELLANAILLLMNGHETTTFAIGNGILALLAYPEQLIRLREDPRLISTAVKSSVTTDRSDAWRRGRRRPQARREPIRAARLFGSPSVHRPRSATVRGTEPLRHRALAEPPPQFGIPFTTSA